MTVKDLIDKLKNFDPDLKVGKTNSFGDFLELGHVWESAGAEKFIVLDIDADIRCGCN